MAYPFSIARALHYDIESGKKYLVVGNFDYTREFIANADEKFFYIDADDTVTFNTGFEDIHGDEIFTGDFLSFPQSDVKMEVVFDVDQGAFFCIEEMKSETETRKDEIIINRKTIFHRLKREHATKMMIVGNLFEEGSDHET